VPDTKIARAVPDAGIDEQPVPDTASEPEFPPEIPEGFPRSYAQPH
jgi:hypothetical protein